MWLRLLLFTALLSIQLHAAPRRRSPREIQCSSSGLLGFVNVTKNDRAEYTLLRIQAKSLTDCALKCYSNLLCNSIKYNETDQLNCILGTFKASNCAYNTLLPVERIRYDARTVLIIDCITCPSMDHIRAAAVRDTAVNSVTASTTESHPCMSSSVHEECKANFAIGTTKSVQPVAESTPNSSPSGEKSKGLPFSVDSEALNISCKTNPQRCRGELLFVATEVTANEIPHKSEIFEEAESVADCAKTCFEKCCKVAVFAASEKKCYYSAEDSEAEKICESTPFKSYVSEFPDSGYVQITCSSCGAPLRIDQSSEKSSAETNKASVGVESFNPKSNEKEKVNEAAVAATSVEPKLVADEKETAVTGEHNFVDVTAATDVAHREPDAGSKAEEAGESIEASEERKLTTDEHGSIVDVTTKAAVTEVHGESGKEAAAEEVERNLTTDEHGNIVDVTTAVAVGMSHDATSEAEEKVSSVPSVHAAVKPVVAKDNEQKPSETPVETKVEIPHETVSKIAEVTTVAPIKAHEAVADVPKEKKVQLYEGACVITFEVDPNADLSKFTADDDTPARSADHCAFIGYKFGCRAVVFTPPTTPSGNGTCELQIYGQENCSGSLRREYNVKPESSLLMKCFRCVPGKPVTRGPEEATPAVTLHEGPVTAASEVMTTKLVSQEKVSVPAAAVDAHEVTVPKEEEKHASVEAHAEATTHVAPEGTEAHDEQKSPVEPHEAVKVEEGVTHEAIKVAEGVTHEASATEAIHLAVTHAVEIAEGKHEESMPAAAAKDEKDHFFGLGEAGKVNERGTTQHAEAEGHEGTSPSSEHHEIVSNEEGATQASEKTHEKVTPEIEPKKEASHFFESGQASPAVERGTTPSGAEVVKETGKVHEATLLPVPNDVKFEKNDEHEVQVTNSPEEVKEVHHEIAGGSASTKETGHFFESGQAGVAEEGGTAPSASEGVKGSEEVHEATSLPKTHETIKVQEAGEHEAQVTHAPAEVKETHQESINEAAPTKETGHFFESGQAGKVDKGGMTAETSASVDAVKEEEASHDAMPHFEAQETFKPEEGVAHETTVTHEEVKELHDENTSEASPRKETGHVSSDEVIVAEKAETTKELPVSTEAKAEVEQSKHEAEASTAVPEGRTSDLLGVLSTQEGVVHEASIAAISSEALLQEEHTKEGSTPEATNEVVTSSEHSESIDAEAAHVMKEATSDKAEVLLGQTESKSGYAEEAEKGVPSASEHLQKHGEVTSTEKPQGITEAVLEHHGEVTHIVSTTESAHEQLTSSETGNLKKDANLFTAETVKVSEEGHEVTEAASENADKRDEVTPGLSVAGSAHEGSSSSETSDESTHENSTSSETAEISGEAQGREVTEAASEVTGEQHKEIAPESSTAENVQQMEHEKVTPKVAEANDEAQGHVVAEETQTAGNLGTTAALHAEERGEHTAKDSKTGSKENAIVKGVTPDANKATDAAVFSMHAVEQASEETSLSEEEIPKKGNKESKEVIGPTFEYLQGCIVVFQADPINEQPAPSQLPEVKGRVVSVEVCAGQCYQNGCTGARYDPKTGECALGFGGKQVCTRGPEHIFYETNETVWIHCTGCRLHKGEDKVKFMIDAGRATTTVPKVEGLTTLASVATENEATVTTRTSTATITTTSNKPQSGLPENEAIKAKIEKTENEENLDEKDEGKKDQKLVTLKDELNADALPTVIEEDQTTVSPNNQQPGHGCVVTFQVGPFSTKPADFTSPLISKGNTPTVEACARLCYENGCTGAQYDPSSESCSLAFGDHQRCDENKQQHTSLEAPESLWIHCISCKQDLKETTFGLLIEETTPVSAKTEGSSLTVGHKSLITSEAIEHPSEEDSSSISRESHLSLGSLDVSGSAAESESEETKANSAAEITVFPKSGPETTSIEENEKTTEAVVVIVPNMATTVSTPEEKTDGTTAKTFVFASESSGITPEVIDAGKAIVDVSMATVQPEGSVPGQLEEIVTKTGKPPLDVSSSEKEKELTEETIATVTEHAWHRGEGDTGKVGVGESQPKSQEVVEGTTAETETEKTEVASKFDENLKKVVAAASLSGAAVTEKAEKEIENNDLTPERKVSVEELHKEGVKTTEPPVAAVSDLVNVISKNTKLEEILAETTPSTVPKLSKETGEGAFNVDEPIEAQEKEAIVEPVRTVTNLIASTNSDQTSEAGNCTYTIRSVTDETRIKDGSTVEPALSVEQCVRLCAKNNCTLALYNRKSNLCTLTKESREDECENQKEAVKLEGAEAIQIECVRCNA